MGQDINVEAKLSSKKKSFKFEIDARAKYSCVDSGKDYASQLEEIFLKISEMFPEETFLAHTLSSRDFEDTYYWWATLKKGKEEKEKRGERFYTGSFLMGNGEWEEENTDTPSWYVSEKMEGEEQTISIVVDDNINHFRLKGFTKNELEEIAKVISYEIDIDEIKL